MTNCFVQVSQKIFHVQLYKTEEHTAKHILEAGAGGSLLCFLAWRMTFHKQAIIRIVIMSFSTD